MNDSYLTPEEQIEFDRMNMEFDKIKRDFDRAELERKLAELDILFKPLQDSLERTQQIDENDYKIIVY